MSRDDKRWKRINRMHALRERIGEWAARSWPAEVHEGMRCWLGPHAPSKDLVLQAVNFALVAPEQGPSLLERYRDSAGGLPRADRVLLDSWLQGWFAICEIIAADPGVGFRLEDVIAGRQVDVVERSASKQLVAGDWIACFLMPAAGGVELEGTSMPLPSPCRIAAVQAFLSGAEARGVDPVRMEPATTWELARPVVAAARNRQRLPCLLNYDRHPVVIITAVLDVGWAELLRVTADWEDAVEDQDAVNLVGRHEPTLHGPLILATFQREAGDRLVLTVNSRERLAAVLARWEAQLGSPLEVLEEEVAPWETDPEGPEVLMDGSLQAAGSVGDVKDGILASRAMSWPELGIPALGGLTPREAVAAGRTPEVRALLPDSLGEDAVRSLRATLGL